MDLSAYRFLKSRYSSKVFPYERIGLGISLRAERRVQGITCTRIYKARYELAESNSTGITYHLFPRQPVEAQEDG